MKGLTLLVIFLIGCSGTEEMNYSSEENRGNIKIDKCDNEACEFNEIAIFCHKKIFSVQNLSDQGIKSIPDYDGEYEEQSDECKNEIDEIINMVLIGTNDNEVCDSWLSKTTEYCNYEITNSKIFSSSYLN
jgi:hypothetical protein